MFFKVHGERNSGTNFLKRLLEKNFGNTFGNQDGNKLVDEKYFFWKHGIPKNQTRNLKENKMVVKVFIFRKLEPWLVSMFHNPYHLKQMDEFETFLTKKQQLIFHTHKYLNNCPVNFDDKDKTIFQIRYYKYKKIKEYCQKNENIILVNLDYLQDNDNCLHFLKEINDKYNLNKKNFSLIEKHTKNSKNIKNTDYDTNYENYTEIIDAHKNEEMEKEINDLTYFIKLNKPKIKEIYSKFQKKN